jgi:hypothetical protein
MGTKKLPSLPGNIEGTRVAGKRTCHTRGATLLVFRVDLAYNVVGQVERPLFSWFFLCVGTCHPAYLLFTMGNKLSSASRSRMRF